MYENNNDPRVLMIAATQHKIAGDFLLNGSNGKQKLPVRAVICEQYAKSIRLALESFAAHKELEIANHCLKMNLYEFFVYCESHGLHLHDTSDFSTENFEMLLVAIDEKSSYRFYQTNANCTADLVWPQLYTAHLIGVIRSIIDNVTNNHALTAVRSAARPSAFPAGTLSGAPGSGFAIGQPVPFPGSLRPGSRVSGRGHQEGCFLQAESGASALGVRL